MQITHMRSRLSISLIALQLAGGTLLIFLLIEFSWFSFHYVFLFYAIPQIVAAIIYLRYDFGRYTNFEFLFFVTSILVCAMILVMFFGTLEMAIFKSEPYIPDRPCSIDVNSPYYCPQEQLDEVVRTVQCQLTILMQSTLVGFLPSMAFFFVRLVRY